MNMGDVPENAPATARASAATAAHAQCSAGPRRGLFADTMPAYHYEALDADGRGQKGLIEADTVRSARSSLRARGLVPMAVEPAMGAVAAGEAPATGWWTQRVLGTTALTVWTRQLAGLVAADLPLERALAALADEADNERVQRLVATLRAEVNAGSSFARALAQHPREFEATYTAVVAAGEQSGQLGVVLESLADDLEAREALRHKLIGASLYPAIVSGVATVSIHPSAR